MQKYFTVDNNTLICRMENDNHFCIMNILRKLILRGILTITVFCINLVHSVIYKTPFMKKSLSNKSSTELERTSTTSTQFNVRNTINIKELNFKASSITNLDFGERSIKYQQLVKTIKAPSPVSLPEEVSMTDDEREWMKRVGNDVTTAFGSMKIKNVGEVVVGFNL